MRTMITAHSGCDNTPDNSLLYLSHALTCGADAFEVDVRMRPNGTLYLCHEVTGEPCPLLADAFRMMQESEMRINCDLKESELEQPVLALARQYGVTDRVLLTGTVSGERLLQSEAVRTRTFWNIPIPHRAERESPAVVSAWIADTIALCRVHGVRTINVNADICSDAVLDALAEAKIEVSAWTVNDPFLAKRLLSHGLCNITTRVPSVLIALRKEV